jgi:hypothetical protein
MNRSRREFLGAIPVAAAALAAPWPLDEPLRWLIQAENAGSELGCPRILEARDVAPPDCERWWVPAFQPTELWPNSGERDIPVGQAEVGQYFRVQAPQDGPRLWVWDPRGNRVVYMEAEAVGPVGPPAWADYLNGLDGRWINVDLKIPQHAVALQGDLPVRRALVTAGIQGSTKPGRFKIVRRVYNETMDSRTIPGMTVRYRYENVLFTQYFTGDGAAIHYNWWANTFGRPGSRGCLGMRYADASFFWEWADLGVPVIIRQ